MSSQANDMLLELARGAAPAYASTGRVAAVVAAGSVGRGLADTFSDLELDIYWSMPPSDEDRRGVVSALGGELRSIWPYEPDEGEWAEYYRLDNCDIGVSGFLAEWMTTCIEDVVERADPNEYKQMRLAAINDGIVLFGSGVVEEWRSRSRIYPDALAVAIATDYLGADRLGSWHQRRALVARDEVLMLRALCPPVTGMVLGALCAVNRILIEHPRFKWTARLVDRMPIAPVDLRGRLWSVANGPAANAVSILEGLLADTIAIVEHELPDVPLAPLRAELAGGRVEISD